MLLNRRKTKDFLSEYKVGMLIFELNEISYHLAESLLPRKQQQELLVLGY